MYNQNRFPYETYKYISKRRRFANSLKENCKKVSHIQNMMPKQKHWCVFKKKFSGRQTQT